MVGVATMSMVLVCLVAAIAGDILLVLDISITHVVDINLEENNLSVVDIPEMLNRSAILGVLLTMIVVDILPKAVVNILRNLDFTQLVVVAVETFRDLDLSQLVVIVVVVEILSPPGIHFLFAVVEDSLQQFFKTLRFSLSLCRHLLRLSTDFDKLRPSNVT